MPWITLPGGFTAHVKMAKPRRRRCSGVGCTASAGKQCDYLVATGKTCNAWICNAHATSVGPDLDHCPKHSGHQAGLFIGLTP